MNKYYLGSVFTGTVLLFSSGTIESGFASGTVNQYIAQSRTIEAKSAQQDTDRKSVV